MAKEYFRIDEASGVDIIWDPLQPEEDNKKLLKGDAKPLERTQKLEAVLKAGTVAKLSDEDVKKLEADAEKALAKSTKAKEASKPNEPDPKEPKNTPSDPA